LPDSEKWVDFRKQLTNIMSNGTARFRKENAEVLDKLLDKQKKMVALLEAVVAEQLAKKVLPFVDMWKEPDHWTSSEGNTKDIEMVLASIQPEVMIASVSLSNIFGDDHSKPLELFGRQASVAIELLSKAVPTFVALHCGDKGALTDHEPTNRPRTARGPPTNRPGTAKCPPTNRQAFDVVSGEHSKFYVANKCRWLLGVEHLALQSSTALS